MFVDRVDAQTVRNMYECMASAFVVGLKKRVASDGGVVVVPSGTDTVDIYTMVANAVQSMSPDSKYSVPIQVQCDFKAHNVNECLHVLLALSMIARDMNQGIVNSTHIEFTIPKEDERVLVMLKRILDLGNETIEADYSIATCQAMCAFNTYSTNSKVTILQK